MRPARVKLAMAGIVLSWVFLSGTTSARIGFHISLGSSRLYGHPGFRHCLYPRHSWHGASHGYRWIDSRWYAWMDRGRYRRWDYDRYRGLCGDSWGHYYYGGPSFSSGLGISTRNVGIWIRNYSTSIVDGPIVVQAPRIDSDCEATVQPKEQRTDSDYYQKAVAFLKRPQLEKSELVETLTNGRTEQRIEAIRNLAGFSSDDNIRKTLENTLISDPDPELRKQAARSLGNAVSHSAVVALEKSKAQDPVRAVRQEAYRSIIKIKGY